MPIDAAELQKRAARNQSLFREHNERLGPASYHYSLDPPFADWACECAVESCSVPVQLTIPEYEAVRAQATHFVVAPTPDHVVADVERVVERRERYWIVEKTGRGAELSKRFDPRSRKRDESRPRTEGLADALKREAMTSEQAESDHREGDRVAWNLPSARP